MPVTHQLSRFGVGSLAIPLFRPDHHHRPPPPPPTFDHLLPTTHTAAYTSHPAPQSLHTGAHITATCARHRRTRSGVPASVAPAHRIASHRSASHHRAALFADCYPHPPSRTHRRALYREAPRHRYRVDHHLPPTTTTTNSTTAAATRNRAISSPTRPPCRRLDDRRCRYSSPHSTAPSTATDTCPRHQRHSWTRRN